MARAGSRILGHAPAETGEENPVGAQGGGRPSAGAGAVLKRLDGTEGIWEVRAEFGGDEFRLLGFWDEGNLIILTNGFAKKTQKTPEREITLAEARRRDHLNRK